MDAPGGDSGALTSANLSCSCGAGVSDTARFCSECGAPVRPAAGPAEFKQVTVLFADVVRSMDIAAAVGPERLREIMAGLAGHCAAVVRRYGGTVDKFTGDGVELSLRVGLNSGQVIAGELGSGPFGYTAVTGLDRVSIPVPLVHPNAASTQLENSHARCHRCPVTILLGVGSGNSTVKRA